MTKIEENQLEKINGGTTTGIWIGVGIVALVIFIAGFLEGLVNPEKCG